MGWIMPPTKYRDGENKALKSKQEFNEKKERAKDNLKRVMKTIGFPDWMVLYMVARYVDKRCLNFQGDLPKVKQEAQSNPEIIHYAKR